MLHTYQNPSSEQDATAQWAEGEWYLDGLTRPGGDAQIVRIYSGKMSVGRRPENDFPLPFSTVSASHAEFTCNNARMFLVDVGSTNGTFVNGDRLTAGHQLEIQPGDLIQFGEVAFRVGQRLRETAGVTIADEDSIESEALALMQFERLLETNGVVPNYQPVVTLQNGSIVGYEVLLRGRMFGLRQPGEMFKAAARLGSEIVLSRLSREEALRQAVGFGGECEFFVNTHPREMDHPGLVPSLRDLREKWPDRRLTLEIHEASVTDPSKLMELHTQLREIDVRLAFDDFGAGQARILELLEVRPDMLKFDISLIRGITDKSFDQRQLVKTLVRMTTDLGVVPLAEGMETEAEVNFCREAGFELGQGFYFGRPRPAAEYL